jgi:hypothetical protein
MEISNKSWIITVISDLKAKMTFDTDSNIVKIDDLEVSYPWEYEKSGILLEVKEYNNILFYSFSIDTKHLVIISNDKFELKEEILSFFGDVDILIITWTKESPNIYESIEARVVIPYGPSKQIFLNSLWQNLEEMSSYKVKWELGNDTTEFVNLQE